MRDEALPGMPHRALKCAPAGSLTGNHIGSGDGWPVQPVRHHVTAQQTQRRWLWGARECGQLRHDGCGQQVAVLHAVTLRAIPTGLLRRLSVVAGGVDMTVLIGAAGMIHVVLRAFLRRHRHRRGHPRHPDRTGDQGQAQQQGQQNARHGAGAGKRNPHDTTARAPPPLRASLRYAK